MVNQHLDKEQEIKLVQVDFLDITKIVKALKLELKYSLDLQKSLNIPIAVSVGTRI